MNWGKQIAFNSAFADSKHIIVYTTKASGIRGNKILKNVKKKHFLFYFNVSYHFFTESFSIAIKDRQNIRKIPDSRNFVNSSDWFLFSLDKFQLFDKLFQLGNNKSAMYFAASYTVSKWTDIYGLKD